MLPKEKFLEEKLKNAFTKLAIAPQHQTSIRNNLNLIKQKDIPTYEHSVRVGLLGIVISEFMHLEPKPLFIAGALHDLGKVLIQQEIVQKVENFSDGDMEIMKRHPIYTYNLISTIYPLEAEIVVRHHSYQSDKYPKRLPKTIANFSNEMRDTIRFFARLLALADSYDALTTRANEKFGEKRKLTKTEAKKILLALNPDQRYLIMELCKHKIFH